MLARTSVARRLSYLSTASKRYTSSRVEGSVAESKGFNKKEQAHENEYARRTEAQQLKKLREQIEAKKAELAKLEEEHNAVESQKK